MITLADAVEDIVLRLAEIDPAVLDEWGVRCFFCNCDLQPDAEEPHRDDCLFRKAKEVAGP